MPEICPHCGRAYANTKALGSHVHYRHDRNRSIEHVAYGQRSEGERKRFRSLLAACLMHMGLRLPRNIERIELALIEIPSGISPALDQYRDAFDRALRKEKLLQEVEELLRQEQIS